MQQQAIVSSATPAWKKAPPKSFAVRARVFLRKPSVLSELERSAEAHIILGTCSARTERQAAEALRVASLFFWTTAFQSISGAFPLNQAACCAAFSGFAAAQACSSA